MNKNNSTGNHLTEKIPIKHFLLIMRIIIILLYICVFCSMAENGYTQNARVTINKRNVTLKEVLNEIESQTDYLFIYNNEVNTNEKVSIRVKQKAVSQVLNSLMENKNLDYSMEGNHIILSVDEKSEKQTEEGQVIIVQQQKKHITGTVVDEAGIAIIGANIVENGTTNGTITDVEGNFSLNIENDAVIRISYIGYIEKEILTNDQLTFKIILQEDTQALEELVVVGYGVQKKETLTGSVYAINADDILSTKSSSVASSIQGKIPGVMIRQQSGEPGVYSSLVNIRGFGAPLLVIDGVVRDGMSDFERLNAEDIESISVLKDASAAIYGMNADKGVIIVTTKKGDTGRTKISYSANLTIKQPTTSQIQQSVDAYNYRILKNEISRNSKLVEPYSDGELEKWRAGTEPGYQDYDWMNESFKKFTNQQQHNLAVSGGTEKITFYSSIGYMNDNGLLKSDIQKYSKIDFRSTLGFNIARGLTSRINFSIQKDKNKSPEGSYFWLFKTIATADRGVSPYTIDDPTHLSFVPGPKSNPLAKMTEELSGYQEWSNLKYQTTINFDYEVPFLKGLSLGLQGAFDGLTRDNSTLVKAFQMYDYHTNEPSSSGSSLYNNRMTNSYRQDYQSNISYNNIFSLDHSVSATLVFEARRINSKYLYGQRYYDDIYTHDIINQGSLTNASNEGSRSEEAYLSYIGRINYGYKDKYLLEFSFREDGSYRYAPSKRWAFFPAVSAGWRIGEEKIVKDNLPMINNLKIRGSYGKIGADAGNPFQYFLGYRFSGIDGGYVFNDNVLTYGMEAPGVVNENLSWMETQILDFGLDLELWDGKFGIVTDVFRKNRDGMLATRAQTVPNTFGASFPQENLNSDKVEGIEIEIFHRNKIRDFNYGFRVNATYARQYLLHIERAPYQSTMQEWKDGSAGNGRITGRRWGYESEGVYTSLVEYETAPLIGGTNGNSLCLPGSLIVTDVNGDGIIDSNDRLPTFMQGNGSNPPLQYGMSTDVSFKGFDFYMLLQGGSMFTIMDNNHDGWGYQAFPTIWERFMDRWHTVDQDANPFDPSTEWIPGKFEALKSNNTGHQDGLATKRILYDATYLRIKSLEIGYTIPKSVTSKFGIENLRIYSNVFNLLTFSSEDTKYFDPERNEGDYGANFTYPLLRSFNFGFNINF